MENNAKSIWSTLRILIVEAGTGKRLKLLKNIISETNSPNYKRFPPIFGGFTPERNKS